MTITDLSPSQVQDALQRTQLNLVFAQFKENPLIQAAHSNTESFILLRHNTGAYDGWRLTNATKDERKDRYGKMIKRFQDAGDGQCFTPDGREIIL